jgi:hypothetical protein
MSRSYAQFFFLMAGISFSIAVIGGFINLVDGPPFVDWKDELLIAVTWLLAAIYLKLPHQRD